MMMTNTERRRLVSCAVAGAVGAGVAAMLTLWQMAVLIGRIVTASALLVWIWREVGSLDAAATRLIATREDDSRATARTVLVMSSTISLVAVGAALHQASREPIAGEIALTSAAMVAVVLSWLVIHTVFVLRYAHLFYDGSDEGGVRFPGDQLPSYRDFAYLGFTVGMTFQVSDTEISSPRVRATVLRHALLSYIFGTAIIATTINVLAGIIG